MPEMTVVVPERGTASWRARAVARRPGRGAAGDAVAGHSRGRRPGAQSWVQRDHLQPVDVAVVDPVELDTISTQQVPNQFGTQRYSIFFEPGTYGSAADPLDFQLGFYKQVAGLGAEPGDVVINGAINVFNQCVNGDCEGTDNFWRSLSNLTLNVDLPRRRHLVPTIGRQRQLQEQRPAGALTGRPNPQGDRQRQLFLQDYCGTGDVSGGYLADDEFNSGIVGNYGQQQYFARNSNIDSWSNYVWNQVFMGDNGAPATSFGCGGRPVHERCPRRPVSEEEPFLYTGQQRRCASSCPAVQRNSVGPSYAAGHRPASRCRSRDFFIAHPEHVGLGDQRRARPRPQPDPYPGRLRPAAGDQGGAPEHDRARARVRRR